MFLKIRILSHFGLDIEILEMKKLRGDPPNTPQIPYSKTAIFAGQTNDWEKNCKKGPKKHFLSGIILSIFDPFIHSETFQKCPKHLFFIEKWAFFGTFLRYFPEKHCFLALFLRKSRRFTLGFFAIFIKKSHF